MLTIQPNFSQRFHSQPMFRGKQDVAEDVDFYEVEDAGTADEFTNSNPRNLPVLASSVNNSADDYEPKETVEDTLTGLQNDINDLTDGAKKLEEKLHPSARKAIDTLCLLGGGAVVGISTKLGWVETSKILNKVANNPAVIKFRANMSKLGKKIANGFNSFKESKFCKSITNKFSEWGKKFADTKFGCKVCAFFKRINESKPVVAVKNFFRKPKKANASQVNDTAGDIVAFSTGASTTVAGAMPDKKKKTENTENNESVENNTQENVDEDEDGTIVD